MALWKDSAPGTASPPSNPSPAPAYTREPEKTNVAPITPNPAPRASTRTELKESLIASDLTIEGKIVGSGHVRIAGRFKGDVQVDGNVSLESGARLEGHVKASAVIVGGELIGNIEGAKRVELLETGVINGDVKAGSLTVAAGSRMRGQVEFGYENEGRAKSETKSFGNA